MFWRAGRRPVDERVGTYRIGTKSGNLKRTLSDESREKRKSIPVSFGWQDAARFVLPLLRAACASYDPEDDGMLATEIRELLSSCAASRDDCDRIDTYLAQAPRLCDARDKTTVDHVISQILAHPQLVSEFGRQLEVFRANVRAEYDAQRRDHNRHHPRR